MVLFLCDQSILFTFLAIPTWTLGLISPAIILKSMNMTWYKNLTHYPSKNSSQRKGSMSSTQLCLLSSEVLLKRLFVLIPQATCSLSNPHFQRPSHFPNTLNLPIQYGTHAFSSLHPTLTCHSQQFHSTLDPSSVITSIIHLQLT